MINSVENSSRHSVVVTYKAGEPRRAQIREHFGPGAEVSFLSDMPPGLRQQTLIKGEAMLSWFLRRELGPSEFGLLKNVRMIQLLSAGADSVPFADVPTDIVIAGNVGAYAEPMAEHVLAMALALAKNLFREHRNLMRGEFNQLVLNRKLSGSICGILGFGGIGRATARLMRGLGMRIYAVNTSGRTDEPVEFIGTLDSLRRVLSESDVFVISLPLKKETRGLIGKQELDWMKPNAILVNVARGGIIDEAALYAHLVSNPDFSAGIDAWWTEPLSHGEFHTSYPFLELPNLIGSPHNSAMVPGITDEATWRAVENVKRFLDNQPIVGIVRREDYV
ncbi:MAG TPA: 2-hydroxyacid dehydrogenase [Nitrospirota bacterium]|nr:2-hydroxyacid dehydrogenase [Nitrospirota bacterium]